MHTINRPRRMRANQAVRGLTRETRLSADSLILPMVVREGNGIREEISSLPGQIRYSPDTLPDAIGQAIEQGVSSFLLFGVPIAKDSIGSGAWLENGVVQESLRSVRKQYPDAYLITDVCLCEYTTHGHCGVLAVDTVDNDTTLPLLAKTALSHIQAGADMVAPADMMDGRVAAIRELLDQQGYTHIPIMSYAVKYASYFYGPFRQAVSSAPVFGDRRSYQMDYHNIREAVYEAELDIAEGADILIVKPAFSYLDIVKTIKEKTIKPVAAYSVSGEYAMIKMAAEAGLINEYGAMCESAVGAFRAGAQILITYFAKELAQAIKKGDIG